MLEVAISVLIKKTGSFSRYLYLKSLIVGPVPQKIVCSIAKTHFAQKRLA